MPDFRTINVIWDSQDTGCGPITYHGEVFQLDTNKSIGSFDTNAASYTIKDLVPDSWYLISIRASNELGVSDYFNTTVKTNATSN